MRKKIIIAILALSTLGLNACRSTDIKEESPVNQNQTANVEKVAELNVEPNQNEIKEEVVSLVNTEKDSDFDGIPDKVDEKPMQHIIDTIAEQGSQKLIILDNIKINSDKLSDEMYKLLDNVRDTLSKESNLKIKIIGHTCDLGTESYNLKLSEKRAHAAHKYLISKNVSKDKMKVEWKGESAPIVKNDSEFNRSKNRRIEIIFYVDEK